MDVNNSLTRRTLLTKMLHAAAVLGVAVLSAIWLRLFLTSQQVLASSPVIGDVRDSPTLFCWFQGDSDLMHIAPVRGEGYSHAP